MWGKISFQLAVECNQSIDPGVNLSDRNTFKATHHLCANHLSETAARNQIRKKQDW